MKRLLVAVCVGAAALLAVRRPAPPPAISALSAPPPPSISQHSRPSTSLGTRFGRPAAQSSSSVVYVVGAVAHPGLYRVAPGARANDAVRLAGGMRADADPAAVNLAERVSDGEEIDVFRVGQTAAPHVRGRTRTRKSSARTRLFADAGAPIDLNTADARALSSIPGIGPALALRIVEYRRLNGPFASLDELADVAGMTQSRIDAMSAYATVNTSQ